MVKWLWQNEKMWEYKNTRGQTQAWQWCWRTQISTANLAMLFPIRIASVGTVMMENNASLKEANMEITVAKMIITNLAAISKSKLLWNCEIHFEIYRHRLHTVTAQPPSEQTERSTNMKWEVTINAGNSTISTINKELKFYKEKKKNNQQNQ